MVVLGKVDCWRETVLIQDIHGVMDASKRGMSQRAVNNCSQRGIVAPNASPWLSSDSSSKEMPSVIRITPPLILLKITLAPLHPSQHRHLHNSFGLCGIAVAIFVACGWRMPKGPAAGTSLAP